MFENYTELMNAVVDKYLSPENGEIYELQSAMHYSASAGGKRSGHCSGNGTVLADDRSKRI